MEYTLGIPNLCTSLQLHCFGVYNMVCYDSAALHASHGMFVIIAHQRSSYFNLKLVGH